jgi:hypothetical protein
MSILRRLFFSMVVLTLFLSACGAPAMPRGKTETPVMPVSQAPPAKAFESGNYRDLFQEYFGKTNAEVRHKLEAAWK